MQERFAASKRRAGAPIPSATTGATPERALPIREREFGKDSAKVALVLNAWRSSAGDYAKKGSSHLR